MMLMILIVGVVGVDFILCYYFFLLIMPFGDRALLT